MTTIYITKYALTAGPFEVDGTIRQETFATWETTGKYKDHAHGKDFWLTKEEALADCERRRKAKLASIDKLRDKIEKIEFKL